MLKLLLIVGAAFIAGVVIVGAVVVIAVVVSRLQRPGPPSHDDDEAGQE